jgi:psiF repeat
MIRSNVFVAGLLASTITLGVSAAALAQGSPSAGNQPSPAQAAQQERMRTCNADAGTRNLAGDARRSFMSDCLAGHGPAGTTSGAATPPTTSARPGASR